MLVYQAAFACNVLGLRSVIVRLCERVAMCTYTCVCEKNVTSI